MMKLWCWKLGLLGLCALMTGWLVRYEAYPGLFADTFVGYPSMFRGGALLSDRYTKVLFEGKPIGYSHSRMDSQDGDDGGAYRIENSTLLQMKVLGSTQTVRVHMQARLDTTHRLQSFSFTMRSSQYQAKIAGTRRNGDEFEVEVDTGATRSTTMVGIPKDVILYSPMTDLAMSRLEPGQEMRIRTLDPVSMTRIDVVCTALGYETIRLGGEDREALALEMAYKGMVVKSWLDEDGMVLRQKTPLGWTMESATAAEIENLVLDAEGAGDLALASVVPCRGNIDRPREVNQLTLRLRGLHLDPEQLRTARQDIQIVSDSEVDVVLRHVPLPSSSPMLGDVPLELQAYLRPTGFVQSDHPEIRAQAQRVVGENRDMLSAARALCDWVDVTVINEATASLPSALDVLHQKVGDCNEHTYLFVGLARSIGLPAKIRIGVVYIDDERGKGFFYHAWPAVHLGDAWYDMDPTLEQEEADATHIALLEGELEKQMQLLQVMGQLDAEVLDQVYEKRVSDD